MVRLLIITSALALAACDEVTYSVKAPGAEKSSKLISVELAGSPARMVAVTEMTDPAALASAKDMLGGRCQAVTGLDRLEGHPIGGEIVVYRASCDSGEYQLLQIGEQVAIADWTGKLVNPLRDS
jgi:hypothetical protein